MLNNDILRRIRYTFDFSDKQMVEIFALGDHTIVQSQLIDWLRKEDDEAFKSCHDVHLASFLNGLITFKRGVKEGAPKPVAEKRLTNNLILNKLKIALMLKAEDMLEILDLADFRLSKHELSAFFRKVDHKHYRECKDQVLRNFIHGLQLKLRPE